MKCFCCNKSIIFFSPTETPNHAATIFRGGGEYGSLVTDHNGLKLSIAICDPCLKEKIHDWTYVVLQKSSSLSNQDFVDAYLNKTQLQKNP